MKAHRIYFPGLDALRGIAFLLIFFFHTIHLPDDGRLIPQFISFAVSRFFLALELFFVLSAFLLTYLGCREWQARGDFSLRNFFGRRILRIWPLYYLILIFSFLLLPLLMKKTGIDITLPDASYYLLFLSNFYKEDHVFFLKFLWTLSVEEQFYVVLGNALKWLKPHLAIFFAAIVGVSIVYSVLAVITTHENYANPLRYLFDFGIGGSLGMALASGRLQQFTLVVWINRRRWLLAFLPVCLLVIWFAGTLNGGYWAVLTGLLVRWLFVVYFGLLIAVVAVAPDLFRNNAFLLYSGRISFGLYCLHGIAITFVSQFLRKKIEMSDWVAVPLMLLITYGMAILSYHFFESKFLALKKKVRSFNAS